jgi:cytochrome c peroxidase
VKKSVITISIFAIFSGYFYCSCKQRKESNEKIIARAIIKQIESFATVKNSFLFALQNNAGTGKDLQPLFLRLRLSYKKIEWAIEYFTPSNARLFNEAPVEEVERSGTIIAPAGLQVMESFLFPEYDTTQKTKLIQQLQTLQTQCEKMKAFFSNIDLFDWQIFDAAKLEVFRIETLGITGFDNPLTLKSMQESAAALRSVEMAMNYYTGVNDREQLAKKISTAINYLQSNEDFNSFNRAEFIIHYANPITKAISESGKRLKIHGIVYNRLLNQDAQTLFDTNAFNANAYTLNRPGPFYSKKIALGKILFADPVFSGNGKRSCQSCHQPDKAFTDGLIRNTLINSNKLLPRNTPTLLNAALQPAQFYDLRANTLEEQAADAINNRDEMNGSLKSAAKNLSQNPKYLKLFADAFPGQKQDGIDSSEILDALASFVRSLVGFNSRFDEYMRGHKTIISQSEINGFNLFMGKAKCATCHYMPLFNGTFPPRYMKADAEVIGVPSSKDCKESDSDEGRYNIIKIASLKHAFKTPTLRNAMLTAPYMHNGVFSTLEEVMDFYNSGGGAGSGLIVQNQTLSARKLNLSKKEQGDLIAFINCLTLGEHSRQKSLNKFSGY